jgi:hypothetical protein
MRNLLPDVLLVNGINGTSIAVLTLNDVKDVVAITLGVVSIVSTLLIIRNNLRRGPHTEHTKTQRKPGIHRRDAEAAEVLAARATNKNKWDADGTRPYTAKEKERLGWDVRRILWAVAILLLFSGCTHFRGRQERAERKVDANRAALDEESRALTTAVVDVLSRAETNCFPAQIALELAKQDQSIEGIPALRIDADALLARDASAWEELRERERYQRKLLRDRVDLENRLRAAEAQLIELGGRYEAEHNASVVKRFWRWLLATFGIGGIVALCVFCPAVIPIVGRVASWVVGKVPSLAGYFGVVSKNAFDAVVRGVGEVRSKLKETHPEVLTTLNTELHKSTDAEHRDLIDARRTILNV